MSVITNELHKSTYLIYILRLDNVSLISQITFYYYITDDKYNI